MAESSNDAIIALPGGPAATALQAALVGLGYNVDTVDDIEEGARLVEQGVYEVAVTSRTPPDPGKPESSPSGCCASAPTRAGASS